MVGQTISHYRIVEKLGEGGMGVVYKAEDTKLRRTVALKFPPRDKLAGEEQTARFAREAQAAAALNHPNICTVHEIDEADGQPFIAMEFVAGQSVRDKVRVRPLPLAEVLDIAIQAAQGLQAAHEKGVVHRDIKSANLMVTAEGQVKVMDFGLAQVGDRSQLTKSGTTLGTAAYMSPEQALAQPLDRRTDIWSLGVVLYEMLTGRLPFHGDVEAAVAYAVVNTEPEPPTSLRSGLPVELDYIVDKALSKSPEERYQHVDELLVDLRAVQSRVGVVKPARRPKKLARRAAVRAVAAAVVALGAAGVYMLTRSRPIDTLAVLPFANAGGDPNTEYLSEGISESLIANLSRVPHLKVKSRDTVFRYQGQDKDVEAVGRELGVRAVLRGRLVQRGDSLSISAELVDTSDGTVLWGNQYRRPVADVLAIDQEISKEISQQLLPRLTGKAPAGLPVPPTRDPEAYRLYPQGRYQWNRRPLGLKNSTEFFQQAVDKDPNYALAWAGLADSFLMLGGWSLTSPAEAYPRAREAANRAIQMEETLAEPHATLGYLKTVYERDWPGAQREFQRAIELTPEYSTAHHWYAFYFLTVGSLPQALAEIHRAQELEPLSPIINAEVGYFTTYARRYEQAVQELRQATEMDPGFAAAHVCLGRVYALQGRREEARAELERAIQLAERESNALSLAGTALAAVGLKDDARRLAEELIGRSRERYVGPQLPGMIYASLGEHDRALEYFEKAVEDRSLIASWLRDPLIDGITSDPRFKALLERIGLRP